MNRSVVITGVGAVSSLGLDVPSLWRGLIEGRSGIDAIEGFEGTDIKIGRAAQVRSYQPTDHFSDNLLPLLDRFSQFALMAGREAVADAGLDDRQLVKAASVVGSGCCGKETDELTYAQLYKQGKRRAHPFTIPRGMPSAAASQVSMQLGITGPVFTVSSACASANHALAQAALMIRSGVVDVALAGGTDAPFTYGLLKAWEALRVVSDDTCRPFSRNRSGLIIGEGSGMLVLESETHARKRGAEIHARLSGIGMSSDAGHITDPSSDGAAQAMRSALTDACLDADQVDYINAHGTGTQANDRTETAAIRQVFSEHADRLMVSSTKGAHGHALGASGALELIATVLAVKQGIVPPTINYSEADDECDLDYVINTAREQRIGAALSNSFAFGGLNAVLAIASC